MTFSNACIYSALGLAVVFFALVLLMCIIKLMTAVSDRTARRTAPVTAAEVPVSAPAEEVKKPLAPGSAGDLKLYDTDPRTAAMLMAIVADELQAPLSELRFLSIREVKEND